jgi:hypothetical protein
MIGRRLAPLLLAAAASLFGIALVEIALRTHDAMQPDPPEPRAAFWKPVQGYGWLHHPGIEGLWYDDRGEFSVRTRMSSHGLRDVEHEFAKPPGTFRILLLGDSYMEGLQVELEQTFARVLERELLTRGRRVEVINASASEWGTDNELVYLREEGFRYEPDLVLLAFTNANDVRSNSPTLNMRVPDANPYKPTFALGPGGELVFHPMPALPPAEWFAERPWWQRSRAITFVARRLGLWSPASRYAATPAQNARDSRETRKDPTVDALVHAPVPPPEIVESWKITRALLLEMKNETSARGAKLALVLVDGPWVYYDEWWQLLTMSIDGAHAWNRVKPNEEMAAITRESAIESLDLRAAFESKKKDEALYFRFDPHWTAAGHRLAAQTTADFLIERGLVPSAR